MELSTAIRLIREGVNNTRVEVWADFGSGTGLFTNALANLLANGSEVYAVDKDASALKAVKIAVEKITLHKIQEDFLLGTIALPSLDGILLANALHFVPDALTFLVGLKGKLKRDGRIILVEYDMSTVTQWVPYPMPYSLVQNLALRAGFSIVEKLGQVSSIYNQTNIYAALLK